MYERRNTGTPQEVIDKVGQEARRELGKKTGNARNRYLHRYDGLTSQAFFGGINTLTEPVIRTYGARIRNGLTIADVKEAALEGLWRVPGVTQQEIPNVRNGLQTAVTFKRHPIRGLGNSLTRVVSSHRRT